MLCCGAIQCLGGFVCNVWHILLEMPFHSVETPSINHDYILDLNKTNSFDNLRDESFIGLIRYRVGRLVDNDSFQQFIVLLISINAIIMGVATFDFVTENASVRQLFDTVDVMFLIIFTVELGLQFIHRGLGLFKDNWLVFDFIVILISWSIDGMQIVRAFRVLRAIRLVVR